MIYSNLIFPYDYIISTIIIILIIFSCWKGFILSILNLLTWVGSVIFTIYTYEVSANLLKTQFIKISILKNYEYLTYILGILISIPVIFIISLFVLRKIRKFLSSDIEQKILGIIFDKLFGIIYGVIFSYFIISAIILMINRYEYHLFKNWINENSYIINTVENFNEINIYNLKYLDNINQKIKE